jgi:hypothetical protein
MRALALLITASILIAQPSFAQPQATQNPPAPLELDGTRKHPVLFTPRAVIRASGDGIYDGSVQVQLSVEIGVDGHVEAAEPIDRRGHFYQVATLFYNQARNLELHRVFQPVLDESGTPVRAHFTDYVEILPPERWLDHPIPFPEHVDLSTFSITLKRTSGSITCREYSGYKTTVSGSGDVTWQTDVAFMVGATTTGHATISREAVQELMEKVRASRMFDALNEYESKLNDGPVYTLMLDVNGVHKQVVDYLGSKVGMPSSIQDLEGTVDRIAGTEKLASCK